MRVQKDVDTCEYISITCDGWTSEGNTHSIVSLTGHFLDGKMQPQFCVLSASALKGLNYYYNIKILEY